MEEHVSRMLVLACSKRKRSDHGLLPAIERYDGPAYRIVRGYLSRYPETALNTYIVSAEHGLIPADREIEYYDRAMTIKRGVDLRPQTLVDFRYALNYENPSDVFLCLGRPYRAAINGYECAVPDNATVACASGPIGRQLSQLRSWLFPPGDLPIDIPSPADGSIVSIRGIHLTFTPDEIIDVARAQMALDSKGAQSYQTWCIEVDSERVAPKWLVGRLTGLHVKDFRTADACRVLMQLGIEVRRV